MSSWLSRNSAAAAPASSMTTSSPLLTPSASRRSSSSNNNTNANANETTRTGVATKDKATMQIDGIAPTFQKKPSIRHEGKKLVFECLIEAEPEPTVKWFHNGQPLPVNPRFKLELQKEGTANAYTARLEISDITIELAGVYTINSKNSLGESSAKINLNFDSEDKSAGNGLDGGCKPSFLEKPIIKQSNDFKQVQFDCKLVANPKPTIQWLHRGEPLDEQSNSIQTMLIPVQTTTSSAASSSSSSSSTKQQQQQYLATLILKGVENDRTGDYKCIATNKHGTNFASINLNFVQGKAKVPDGRAPKFPRKPVIKQSGPVLTIECVVEARPRPTITWYHDHETIIKEDSKHSHCSWQVRGPITSESELRAMGVLEGDDAFPPTSGPTRTSFSSSASSRRSSAAGGGGAAKRDVYVVTLDIRHPKARDGGTYRCNAVNELGESSANIALNFQTAPQQKEKQKKEEQAEEEAMEEAKEERAEQKSVKRTKQQRDQLGGGDEQDGAKENQADSRRGSAASSTAAAARRTSTSSTAKEPLGVSKQQWQADDGRKDSIGSTQAASRRVSGASSVGVQPMEVDGEPSAAANNANPISDERAQPMDSQDGALDRLPPAKRTSSTSSTKRTTSVKKKRPSLLAAPGSSEEAAGPGAAEAADEEAGPTAKRVVKKRVSVKRDASGLKDIVEGKEASGLPPTTTTTAAQQQRQQAEQQQQQLRRDSAASNASNLSRKSSSTVSTIQAARDRLKSFTLETPVVIEPEKGGGGDLSATPRGSTGDIRGSAKGQARGKNLSAIGPRLSVSDTSKPEEQDDSSNKLRGTYDGLRGAPIDDNDDDDEDPEAAEERRRYLATRGGGGAGPSLSRESLSPTSGGQQNARQLLSPTGQQGKRDSSASPTGQRPESPQAGTRRGSILLVPDGGSGDARRPSIIVADDNKLRPGEIADRRRRSSIDIRRASAMGMEKADKPSTPLKPCGKKPIILDFQDNISGTENQTSYLTFGLEGDPVPTLRFFKGDSEIYEGGRYSIVTDGDTNTVHFCIRKSKPIDEAKYKVIATNCHGEDTASMQLFVSDESGMDFRAMLKHRQYQKWRKEQDDPNWGNLKGVEEERLAQIKEPKRPDNFLKPLQNMKVKQGKDLKVRFECVFSKSGVKAKWYRNNKEIFPNKRFHLDSRGDLHVLEIDGPFVDDSGKFTCQCLDTKCSAMLEVEEPDPVYKFVKILAKGYGQHLNRELVLEVSCNSYKAQVQWYKDDAKCAKEPLVAGDKYAMEMDKYGKKILRIRNCQFEDSGPYTCKIMNTPKDDETTTTQVQISEKKFQIMKPLYSQRATEDDKIVLECEVDEYDAPVKWYRKDRETGKWKELKPEQMKHKEIVVEGKKRRLIIKKAKCQDEGEYKCCTNADETSCELFVEPSNKWRKKLTDVTIVEDEPLVLDVELMDRKPGVAAVWVRNGKEIGHQGGGGMQTTADERIQFKTIDDKLQLVIEHAKTSDAGDWSVLFNKMKCSCKVTVLPAEKAPTMRFPTQAVAADVGKPQTIEIPYSVAGTKQSAVVPKVLCNGQPVPANKIELVVKDDKIIMKLKDPQRADSNDNYEFVLENAKGKQTHKFKLDVQGPPGTPEGPLKITDVFKDSCKLQWERPLDDGGSPIAHYVVERQEVGTGRTTWTECGITSTCQLDVNDLSPKKEYKFRVRAVNKKGKSEPLMAAKSIVAKDPYDPPSEPENVSVVNWDKDFVDLEWEAPLKDGGIPLEKYIIEAKGKFGQDWVPIKEVAAGQGCKAHITETLKEGQQLQFRVRAANKMGAGEPSKATKPVAIKARFVRPYIAGDGLKNIVVKKGRPIRYEINFNGEPPPEITWIANDQELRCITDKCEVEKADKKTTLLVTNTTRLDSGRYKLILKNTSGECVSEADVVVLDRPSAPEGPLVMEEIKSDQVTIKWRKPKDTGGEDIDGYVVEKMNLETGRWVPAGECGPNEEMFTVKGLLKGKKYKFRVRAKNKEGESEALETNNTLDVGEEPSVQKCPSKVTVGQGETAKVKIHFAGDPSEIRITNMDTGATIGEGGADGSAGPDKPKYTIFDDYLVVTIPNADKNKDAGRYKVELKNKIGTGEASFDLDVTGTPGAPQGPLEIGEVTENSVGLSWRPPADDGGSKVTHYVVERRDTANQGDEEAWIEVTAACKDTNFTVTGLTKDNAYEFRVRAVNDNGQSKPLVSDVPVTAKLPYDPPSAPGKPEATPISEDSVQLEWERPKSDGGSRITGYFIEKREVGSDTWQKVNANLPCTTNDFVVKNLIEDRKYEFRVVAQNAAGLSEPSECSAQTLVKDPNATDVPKFVKPLKKTVAVENGSFELECIVQGHPPPTVTWCKGNRELRNSEKYCMTQESGPDGTTIFRLLVPRAAADDADEYSIKATNKAGSRTSRCDVTVQTKPKIHVPPRLAQGTDGAPIAFDRGESIQLKIPFTGNPPPEVHWFKGDEEIEPGAQFDIEADERHTTLTIRDATREDSGEYRLVVKNALGEDSASFNISVADRPEPPRFPTVSDVADDAAVLNWKAPVWDGGSQITQYIIEKRELPMTSWIRAGATRFLSQQVVNLNEEKDYEFRVIAENIYGRSEPSEVIKCTTKQSGRQRKKASWPLDKDGKKIRTTAGSGEPVDDYDKFVKDGPAIHVPTDIKTCPITDNYEILEKIGEGVFGEVYRVKEKATGDYFAAKFTPTNTNEEKNLLKKEIDVINTLHHKNILRLHDAYEDDDEMVTVHEFISGPEVFEKIYEPGYQMTEEQVRKYMRDVCEAVRHMHDRSVIHLDLKPENLMLQSKNPLNPDHEPKVKIIDFGLACKLDPHEICKISTSAADYAAPEILEHDSVGFYTDMWAIGVLTYVLLSGNTPFGSHADIKQGEWSFADPVFDKCTPECKDFIEKLLVKQKEKRLTAHECLEHPWLREDGDEETRRKRKQVLNEHMAYRRQRDAMKGRYLDWWDKSIVPIGHISNYSPLRKLHADRYKIFDALIDRRELAPRFVIKPQSTFAYEGQSANFHCFISSDSPVIVSWFKDNRELKQSVKYMKRYTMDNNFTFNVNRCKMSDFGEYVIRAENHHGAREEPVFLDVRKRPVDFTPVHLEPMKRKREPEPPKFEEEPDSPPKFTFILRPRIIQSGLGLKLLCCLKGKPAPTITWYKDGKELSKRDYTLTHSDGVVTLEIAACDTSHTGKYTCHAQNPLGEDKTIADVLIEGKRTFTPTPMGGIIAGPSPASMGGYSTSSSSSYAYPGARHQRSLSLSRHRSATPPPTLSTGTGSGLSSTLQAANLHLLPPQSLGAGSSREGTVSATLYSPNFSMTTNRYLRRSYKAGPLAGSTSTTPLPTGSSYRTGSRLGRSRIPILGSRLPMRTLSSFGRSSSSLH